MTEPQPDQPQPDTAGSAGTVQAPARRLSRGLLPVALSGLALAGVVLLWFGAGDRGASDAARAEELARLQRRLSALEDRIQRERDDLIRLGQRIGAEGAAEDTLTGRVNRLEDALARMPGAGQQVRFAWLIAQAEYYMRIANAQETLAGDVTSALTALQIADEHLRDAADPRLTGVRRRLAGEIATLRALPKVDTEGMVLKLGTLAGSLEQLPRKRVAPASFSVTPESPAAGLSGLDRALQALRNALLSIVSIRRTDDPVTTLMSDEAVTLLIRSLELELQMARLALLRGETPVLKSALDRVQRELEQHFDTSSPEGAGALATVRELAAAPMPAALPDISGSLAELLSIKGRELRQ